MKYFKNVEAAAIYRVSEKAIRNWIASARQGKLDLELHEHNGKYYIANTTKNHTLITQLAERGQKYKNSRAVKTIHPKSLLYATYGPEQIYDIFAHIDKYREIPLHYSYFDGGAKQWDLYTQRLYEETTPNILNSSIDLLKTSTDYILNLAKGYGRINVVDLGVGNALPVRDFLSNLLKAGFAIKYIGVDMSEEMLKIADQNIQKWFGPRISFEQHALDITRDQFTYLLANEAFTTRDRSALNIILLLGGTITNFRNPFNTLQLINSSLGRDDILIYTNKLDSVNARRYFDFDPDKRGRALSPRHRLIIDMLNIDESFYETEQLFDQNLHTRSIRIILKIDLRIEFEIANQQKFIVINKGESIILWRALHQNDLEIINQFGAAGFDLLQASKTQDQEYLLTISKVKSQ